MPHTTVRNVSLPRFAGVCAATLPRLGASAQPRFSRWERLLAARPQPQRLTTRANSHSPSPNPLHRPIR